MTQRVCRSLMVFALVVIALLASSVLPAYAGGRVFFGVGVGVPLWYPWPYPYAYPYPYPAYSPPVVVQSSPPVYVQREPSPPPQSYWYYCQASQAYYPYVKECPGGWLQVVPQTAPPPSGPPR